MEKWSINGKMEVDRTWAELLYINDPSLPGTPSVSRPRASPHPTCISNLRDTVLSLPALIQHLPSPSPVALPDSTSSPHPAESQSWASQRTAPWGPQFNPAPWPSSSSEGVRCSQGRPAGAKLSMPGPERSSWFSGEYL